MKSILVVDDEANILKVVGTVLDHQGFDTACVESAEEALELLRERAFDLMITDFYLGEGLNGLKLVDEARKVDHALTVIMITGHGTVDLAVQAMKAGVFDFVTKPFKIDILLKTVRNAIERGEAAVAGVSPDGSAHDVPLHFGTMVGESDRMAEVYRLIERVGRTDVTVLIQGESGTGKELVAEAIHKQSVRGRGPYIPLNCAALSPTLLESEMFGHVAGSFTGATKNREGLFAAADGGTLFLDEISSMDLGIQGKLLRALQEKCIRRVGDTKTRDVDVRVIAACNEPLEQKRNEGEFREDLYYRISVVPINLPPLRYRGSDIPLLAQHFCRIQGESMAQKLTFGDGVLEALRAYSWPGNVRELQNAIACAAVLCENCAITVSDLPPSVRGELSTEGVDLRKGTIEDTTYSLRDYLQNRERDYIQEVLNRAGGDLARAADMLGISRATMYRKLPEQ